MGETGIRLDSKVARYRFERFPHFDLGRESLSIERLVRHGMAEAAIFHAARILEVIIGEAADLAGQRVHPRVYLNLEKLNALLLIDRENLRWANALRRLGNDVRHIVRPVDPLEAELGLLMVERCLIWFFCDYSLRKSTSVAPSDIRVGLTKSARQAVKRFESQLEPSCADDLTSDELESLAFGPVLAAVAAETLNGLDGGEKRAAQILAFALEKFPEDLRLRQLQALELSRTGTPENLDSARRKLRKLRGRSTDGETEGILGGVYKRQWMAERQSKGDRASPRSLLAAHKCYTSGWNNSDQTDTYHGINVAATAIWLGRPRTARRVARECRELIENSLDAILARAPDFQLPMWEKLTLAEAGLILGEIDTASRHYREAEGLRPDESPKADIAGTDARMILEFLGLGGISFPGSVGNPWDRECLRIAVTGHRTLGDDARLAEKIDDVLSECAVQRGAGHERILLYSALAEGADQAVAKRVVSQLPDRALAVIVPMEIEPYLATFSSDRGRAEFWELAGEAVRVEVLEPRGAAVEDAYEHLGDELVKRCEVLIALWDGEEGRGRGGTHAVIKRAEAANLAVHVIRVARD